LVAFADEPGAAARRFIGQGRATLHDDAIEHVAYLVPFDLQLLRPSWIACRDLRCHDLRDRSGAPFAQQFLHSRSYGRMFAQPRRRLLGTLARITSRDVGFPAIQSARQMLRKLFLATVWQRSAIILGGLLILSDQRAT
jgi:hypothetical protein